MGSPREHQTQPGQKYCAPVTAQTMVSASPSTTPMLMVRQAVHGHVFPDGTAGFAPNELPIAPTTTENQ